LKILHIWSTSSHGTILSKEMNKYAEVSSKAIAKKFIGDYITEDLIPVPNSKIGVLYSFYRARRVDIVNIHTIDRILPWFKRAYPNKKVVLTYHGSEIRSNNYDGASAFDLHNNKQNQWHLREKYWKHADAIIVSTADLMRGAPSMAQYIPAPIDREMWKRKEPYTKNTAIYSQYTYWAHGQADKIVYRWATRTGVDLTVIPTAQKLIPYAEYPRFLERFEYYLDVKQDLNGEVLESMSSTGLQFLSLGGKVYHNGKIYKKFPKEADSKNVAKKIYKIYEEVLNG